MRRVIVESPFAGKTKFVGFDHQMGMELCRRMETAANVRYARAAVRDSVLRGEAPIASHLLLTQPEILNDDVPAERELGIEAGLAWQEAAHAAVVYTDRGYSGGMRYGMERAQSAGLHVEERSMPGDWSTEALVPWSSVQALARETALRYRGQTETSDFESHIASALMHARGWAFIQISDTEAEWRRFRAHQDRPDVEGDQAFGTDRDLAFDAASDLVKQVNALPAPQDSPEELTVGPAI